MYYNNNPGNWIGLFLNLYKKKGADVTSELPPVKRTMKKYKIFPTSNVIVAGRFLI